MKPCTSGRRARGRPVLTPTRTPAPARSCCPGRGLCATMMPGACTRFGSRRSSASGRGRGGSRPRRRSVRHRAVAVRLLSPLDARSPADRGRDEEVRGRRLPVRNATRFHRCGMLGTIRFVRRSGKGLVHQQSPRQAPKTSEGLAPSSWRRQYALLYSHRLARQCGDQVAEIIGPQRAMDRIDQLTARRRRLDQRLP